MTIELPGNIEEQLRDLAAKQGREVRAVVEDAVRQYLESLAVTDLDSTQVAETQTTLLDELAIVSKSDSGYFGPAPQPL